MEKIAFAITILGCLLIQSASGFKKCSCISPLTAKYPCPPLSYSKGQCGGSESGKILCCVAFPRRDNTETPNHVPKKFTQKPLRVNQMYFGY